MQFRTRLDYSNNRQIKQRPETLTILSGATSFGLTFSGLTTGPDLNTSAITQTYSSVVSTFSGNNTTTNYTWYDSRMSLGEINLTALTPTYSSSTQQTGALFSVATTTVIDGNTVNLTYTGVSFDIIATSMNDLGGGAYSGTVLTNNLDILSANTLGFTSRTIWADVSGITRTERLIITKNPQVGNVWTCIDSEGMGEWSSISGGTDTYITGGTYTAGTAVFTNTTGGTFNVSGFSTGNTTLYWYDENNTPPTTTPIASGSGSIALGDGAQALGSNMFVYGANAGYEASGVTNSNFLGSNSGNKATNASYSNFFGSQSGSGATSASYSVFIGREAGLGSTSASASNLFGYQAGYLSTNAFQSNFFGYQAGYNATNANDSNFLGIQAGYSATSANNSNFLGQQAGQNAKNSNNSNFIGRDAGYDATGSSYSNLIGYKVGKTFTSNNIGSNNIIIGTNISLPDATTNSINIGGVLFGINTYNTTTGDPSIAATASGKIGVGVVTPTEGLDVALNARIRTIGSSASAGALHYDVNGVLTTNTSDIRLKSNISTLTNALDKVNQLRGVTYKWNDNLSGQTRIGFIAQEVEAVLPELTFINENSPEKYMGVHYDNTVALLVEAIKELSDIIKKEEVFNNDVKLDTLTIPLYTPTSSNDTTGSEGNITRDNNYLYIKTNDKWGRLNLENF